MKKKSQQADYGGLRAEAEKKLEQNRGGVGLFAAPEDTARLVHELEVHQIELEIQNEELRAAREAAKAALEKYTELYDFAPVGYCVVDDAGVILEANLTAAKLLRLDRSKLINRRFGIFISEESRPLFNGLLEAVNTAAAHMTCEVALAGFESPRRYMRLDGATVEPAPGKGRVWRITMTDITERKRADDLARSNQDLALFASVASHDLQEPLREVLAFIKLLEEKYRDIMDEETTEYIGFVVDGATRMQTLIRDLLAWSRVGGSGAELRPTDAQEALDEGLSNLGAGIHESGAVITYDKMPTVNANASQLAMVFQNLIGNAIKFCKSRPPEIHIGVRRQDDCWQFSVRDNGIGFDPEFAKEIFQIFKRLHSRGEYPGTGIGLAICQKVIEQHGGEIHAESEPDKGATFHFTLPAGQESVSLNQ